MTPRDDGISRRAFFGGVAVSTVALVGFTAGQSVDLLAPVNLFGPRVKGAGPQGVPINRTAAQAEVSEAALDPRWALTLRGPDGTRAFPLDALQAMSQITARLPIACVEGWSTTADWRGVRLAALLDEVGAPPDATVRITSLQRRGAFRATTMTPEFARDPLTLVALELNGAPLDLDHGYPARIIAPARPGVLQTKWLSEIEVMR
jgi:DMSO/TMAO reductase YedYZ molybdopterin-dependent catalytic subunit